MSDSQFLLHIDLISNMRRELIRAGPRSLASLSRSPAGKKHAERDLALVDERFDRGPVDQDLDRLDMPRHRRRIALAGHRLVREGHGRASDAEVQGRAIGDLDLGQGGLGVAAAGRPVLIEAAPTRRPRLGRAPSAPARCPHGFTKPACACRGLSCLVSADRQYIVEH